MKKKVFFILINIILIFNLVGSTDYGQVIKSNEELKYEDIVDKIIRFHVLANSDTEEDQKLKLKVRDEVINYISPKLKDSKSLDESRRIIKRNKEKIEQISKKVIKDNGYDYEVTSMISRENFPDKIYGDLIFPQGEYEAYRILIGKAKGQNWWCVMFPPLCFVDETKNIVDSSEIKESIENEVNEDKKEINKDKIKFKFRLFEILFKNKS